MPRTFDEYRKEYWDAYNTYVSSKNQPDLDNAFKFAALMKNTAGSVDEKYYALAELAFLHAINGVTDEAVKLANEILRARPYNFTARVIFYKKACESLSNFKGVEPDGSLTGVILSGIINIGWSNKRANDAANQAMTVIAAFENELTNKDLDVNTAIYMANVITGIAKDLGILRKKDMQKAFVALDKFFARFNEKNYPEQKKELQNLYETAVATKTLNN